MMRTLLIVSGLIAVGAAFPQLAPLLLVLAILLSVVWIGVLRIKWSVMGLRRGDRR
ncbi:hypothetical protein HLB23_39400 [Nocardia uniformis]|uniref:Uncharacterized protein n=1 Tax=Nocardia uniformis TaxID=53432 RepID=A0A849CB50_9NOCA|nr:hypothetical protein [Nocardia uniformis]NNH75854.1 hypothetical protein [Nocardia uniformis]